METHDKADDVISLTEAGEYLRVSVTTIRRLAYDGQIKAIYEPGSKRISAVTTDSVMQFEQLHPGGPSRKTPWTSTSRIEPHIYREPRKGGRVSYRVKVHGMPGRTFSQLKPARMYRDKQLAQRCASKETPQASSDASQSLWSRMFGWLGASKSPIA